MDRPPSSPNTRESFLRSWYDERREGIVVVLQNFCFQFVLLFSLSPAWGAEIVQIELLIKKEYSPAVLASSANTIIELGELEVMLAATHKKSLKQGRKGGRK